MIAFFTLSIRRGRKVNLSLLLVLDSTVGSQNLCEELATNPHVGTVACLARLAHRSRSVALPVIKRFSSALLIHSFSPASAGSSFTSRPKTGVFMVFVVLAIFTGPYPLRIRVVSRQNFLSELRVCCVCPFPRLHHKNVADLKWVT